MNKICTSIEQSKKFIELGIDVNTADMHYNNLSITHGSDYVDDFNAELMDYNSAVKLLTKYIHNPLFEIIPAWSLSALLGLMPFHIIENNVRYEFQMVKGLNKEGGTYKIKYKSYTSLFETLMYNNPIDAAFEMVCWLKENGKI